MKQSERFSPVSGCLPCPIQVDGGLESPPFNAFPGVPHPGLGVFSIPLNAFYLPMDAVQGFGLSLIVGEIDADKADEFLAIASHELSGHNTLYVLLANRLARHQAVCAYQEIDDILRGDESEEHWWFIEYLNQALGELMRSTAFVQELFATWFGVQGLLERVEQRERLRVGARTRRRMTVLPLTTTRDRIQADDGIEETLIARQSESSKFGPRFREAYDRLAALYAKQRDQRILLHLADFLTSNFKGSDESDGKPHIIAPDPEDVAELLFDSLSKLETITVSAEQLKRMSASDVDKLLASKLPDFGRWKQQSRRLHRALTKEMTAFMERVVADRGNPNSPALIATLFEKGYGRLDVLPPIPLLDLEVQNWSQIPDDVQLQFREAMLRKHVAALARNRALVVLDAGAKSVTTMALALVPYAQNGGATVPMPVAMAAWPWDEWVERRARLQDMGELMFLLDSLRQQVSIGGLECPFRVGPRCCGMRDALARFWRVGERARRQLNNGCEWTAPTECPEDA